MTPTEPGGAVAPWQPTVDPAVDGDLAARIEAAVLELTDALHARAEQTTDRAAQAVVHAEHALLRAYVACAAPDQGHEAAAMDSLDRTIETLSAASMGAALHGGLAGIGWITEHVQTLLGAPPPSDEDDGNVAVDAALHRALETTPWPRGHDLVGGLAGIGVYALERAQRPSGMALLERVVVCLDGLAEPGAPAGRCFRIPSERLPPAMRAHFPHGTLDLGMAHGAPGVIALLARAHAAGAAAETMRARALAEDAARWVLAQRLPPELDACFVSRLAAGAAPGADAGGEEATMPARSAWCYGDPGVAVALLLAGRLLDMPAWEEAALVAARKAAVRSFAATKVTDAGLCHGAAGLAHVFQRLFQATGEVLFRDAARSWIDRILDMRRPGTGIAGFSSWAQDPATGSTESVWREDASLLTGATGIALALLAAVAPQEPAWDRLFLVDRIAGHAAGGDDRIAAGS